MHGTYLSIKKNAHGCRLLKKILPSGNRMPNSRSDARSLVTSLGLDYNCIHACPNDCVLYRGAHIDATHCPICGEARYKRSVVGEQTPCKVLRHFPIIPRIQHMYRSKSIAELMTWHATHRSTDGKMRIPADSLAWQHIEEKWPEFKDDPHHMRLGLGTDGVNPFGLRSTSWSTWPVVLINYNLPPWMAIKKGFVMLALLIPGPHKVKNMDVYLEPLIDELQILWHGIHVHDVSRPIGSRYSEVKGILMWTMHDYPGYSECSG